METAVTSLDTYDISNETINTGKIGSEKISSEMVSTKFDKIEDIISDFAAGKMVIILDNEDRENEGDLIMAADKITVSDICFMLKYGSGIICIPMPESRCEKLGLPLMVPDSMDNHNRFSARFTLSIEASTGVTTGISAEDRVATIKACIDPAADKTSTVSPGHMFPLMARPGGVLERPGHTESGCDLAKLAGFESESAVLVEILNPDGSVARRDELITFAKQHNLKIGTVDKLIKYRRDHDK